MGFEPKTSCLDDSVGSGRLKWEFGVDFGAPPFL